MFILDVRNEDDYRDWKIEGEAVTSINIPYFDLLDGVEGVLEQFPKNQQVLVVCAKEGSSKFIAEMLVEAGVEDVAYLQGGMKTWSEYLYQAKVYEDQDVKVYQFIRVGKGCLSYMVVKSDRSHVVL